MEAIILNQADLSGSDGTHEMEGGLFGNTNVSLILVDLPRGDGPRLHRHPYPEVFVIHEGQAIFTVGSSTVEAHAGQIIIVPAGVSHKFVNSGPARLRQTDIHLNPRMVIEWLE